MNWEEEREAMERERTPSKGIGITPTMDLEYQQQWEYELKRLIWNAKKLAERLHQEPTNNMERYEQGIIKVPPTPPLTRSAEAYVIRELLNYISDHDKVKYMEIELKIKQEEK